MSALDAVLGRKSVTETTTASAIPVVATVPSSRQTIRGRGRPDEDAEKRQKSRRASTMRAVLGESQEDGAVIPDDAEELKGAAIDPSGLNLRDTEEIEPKKKVDAPKDDTERLLTPRAALVAPDVTPESMTEIDPSLVPGHSSSTSFRASDVESEPSTGVRGPASPGAAHQSEIAMNILMGRQKPSQGTQPAGHNTRPAETAYESAPPVMPQVQPISESAAEAMFSAGQVDVLKQNQPMPDHKQGDGQPIFSAFRRFNR
jgi:hypothetical protein